MTENLSKKQKEPVLNNLLSYEEEVHQKKLTKTKMKIKSKTSRNYFEVVVRPVCNKCQAAIRLYEMGMFSRNGGQCQICQSALK